MATQSKLTSRIQRTSSPWRLWAAGKRASSIFEAGVSIVQTNNCSALPGCQQDVDKPGRAFCCASSYLSPYKIATSTPHIYTELHLPTPIDIKLRSSPYRHSLLVSDHRPGVFVFEMRVTEPSGPALVVLFTLLAYTPQIWQGFCQQKNFLATWPPTADGWPPSNWGFSAVIGLRSSVKSVSNQGGIRYWVSLLYAECILENIHFDTWLTVSHMIQCIYDWPSVIGYNVFYEGENYGAYYKKSRRAKARNY